MEHNKGFKLSLSPMVAVGNSSYDNVEASELNDWLIALKNP